METTPTVPEPEPETRARPFHGFADRAEAGRELGRCLKEAGCNAEAIVLALPRGGVPVGLEVARALGATMDVFLVRKLGVPSQPELAMGAIASGGVRLINEPLVHDLHISEAAIAAAAAQEERELTRREALYRAGRVDYDLKDRTVILVDDGLATGYSMMAAVLAVRAKHPWRVVVGTPVGAPETCERLGGIADQVVCCHKPEQLKAVGLWYRDFSQLDDAEVVRLLDEARATRLVA